MGLRPGGEVEGCFAIGCEAGYGVRNGREVRGNRARPPSISSSNRESWIQ